MSAVFSFITCLLITGTTSLQENYYWRDYKGTVPVDAVLGGKDASWADVFIGQAYERDSGLIPVQIYGGGREVSININGKVKKVVDSVQVLCGPAENFYWLPARSDTLKTMLGNNHAVIGGHLDDKGELSIGRIVHKGEHKIGRILPDGGQFFYNDEGKEGTLEYYEILVYKNSTGIREPASGNLDSEIAAIFQGL